MYRKQLKCLPYLLSAYCSHLLLPFSIYYASLANISPFPPILKGTKSCGFETIEHCRCAACLASLNNWHRASLPHWATVLLT